MSVGFRRKEQKQGRDEDSAQRGNTKRLDS